MKNNVFILKVVDASYVDDYTLMLTFNNGDKRKCDFAPLSKKGICTKLQDLDYFKSFSLDPFTVDWNNEIGFAPEFLYEHLCVTTLVTACLAVVKVVMVILVKIDFREMNIVILKT